MRVFIKVMSYVYRLLFQSIMNRFTVCRYKPTCSQYMEQAVEKYGYKGFYMGLRRIVSCHPFSKRPIYDPVDRIEN